MRKMQKKQAEEFLNLLGQAHNEIKTAIRTKEKDTALELLEQCQDGAIKLGNMIEKVEGEGFPTIHLLENYCELVYGIYEEIAGMGQYAGDGTISENGQSGKGIPIEEENLEAVWKHLDELLMQIENSIHNDIKIRKEAVFLPYKAAMWDSLESVWKAAEEDPDCDAYVIPIPYFDKKPDGSLGEMHYEGKLYPEYVPVTKYDEFDFQDHHPDMIFIHNPYDMGNAVTSIHPYFYSGNIKKFTDCLVYIPYYITTGGMSEGQSLCSAYIHADYIVIQSEKFRKFFDARIPDEKFQALGSPKADSIWEKCQNPPEAPVDWKRKMSGKKVYFYNTSLGGMLENTEKFLKKMEYVFRCFQGREDACLLWRPHPLMESTLDSMRAEYRPVYDTLKQKFIQEDLGIFDDTPDIEKTIALSDVYIGDAGTSVTALFGIAGKPMFILNNSISHEPQEEDWRGEIITGFRRDGYDEWKITQGNKLYYSRNKNYRYEYYCDLSEYAAGGYYSSAIEGDGKVYVCPANAQDILIIKDREIVRKIELEQCLETPGAFYGAWRIGAYLFLIPNKYPSIVRLDTRDDKVSYIMGANEAFIREKDGERRIGGSCVWKEYLMLGSPTDSQVLAIRSDSMETQVITIRVENSCGCWTMATADKEIWLLPYEGRTVTCWNPDTGEVKEYSGFPDTCHMRDSFDRYTGENKESCLLTMAVSCKDSMIFSPGFGNMFLILNKDTGQFQEWKPPFGVNYEEKSDYFPFWSEGTFVRRTDTLGEWTYRYYDAQARKLYDVNLENGEYREIAIEFDKKELARHAPGFDRTSEWMAYSCCEDAFNSLPDLLDGNITGKPFDKARQMEAYGAVVKNNDGTCGEKIYRFAAEG